MNLGWYRSESTVKPLEVDTTTSKKYIYLRKNIEESQMKNDDGESYTVFNYDEAKLTQEEYEIYLKEITATQTLDNIETLKAENESLLEQVDMLTNCILEMSEMIYA